VSQIQHPSETFYSGSAYQAQNKSQNKSQAIPLDKWPSQNGVEIALRVHRSPKFRPSGQRSPEL